eukprot:160314-Chlamydomonas_euryale.AAC.3
MFPPGRRNRAAPCSEQRPQGLRGAAAAPRRQPRANHARGLDAAGVRGVPRPRRRRRAPARPRRRRRPPHARRTYVPAPRMRARSPGDGAAAVVLLAQGRYCVQTCADGAHVGVLA